MQLQRNQRLNFLTLLGTYLASLQCQESDRRKSVNKIINIALNIKTVQLTFSNNNNYCKRCFPFIKLVITFEYYPR